MFTKINADVSLQYHCKCGAGAVGMPDEKELISEWITEHRKECDLRKEDYREPVVIAQCNECEQYVFDYDPDGLEEAQERHVRLSHPQ